MAHQLIGPGSDGLYKYRGATIEVSGWPGRYHATIRFRSRRASKGAEVDVVSLTQDGVLEIAKQWIDDAPELRGVGESRRYSNPPEPPHHFVSPRASHRVADFSTLPELVKHARSDLGATHVAGHGTETRIYFPRGDGRYEEATVWQKGNYWHATGPGARQIVRSLPRGAQPLTSQTMRRASEARQVSEPIDRWWRALPPGVERKINCATAKAMVDYMPYLGTPYDISRSSVGSIEVCFESLEDARRFFDRAISSGHIERAELRQDAKGAPRGRLIDEFDNSANETVGEPGRAMSTREAPRRSAHHVPDRRPSRRTR